MDTKVPFSVILHWKSCVSFLFACVYVCVGIYACKLLYSFRRILNGFYKAPLKKKKEKSKYLMPCLHIQHTDQTLYLGPVHWGSCLLKSGKKCERI